MTGQEIEKSETRNAEDKDESISKTIYFIFNIKHPNLDRNLRIGLFVSVIMMLSGVGLILSYPEPPSEWIFRLAIILSVVGSFSFWIFIAIGVIDYIGTWTYLNRK